MQAAAAAAAVAAVKRFGRLKWERRGRGAQRAEGGAPSAHTHDMGAAASMPACRGAAWAADISHAQRVTRLYRAALRTSRDWTIDYDMWVAQCEQIRARFRANQHKSALEGKVLVDSAMAELFSMRHPDPYIPIYRAGSSSYQRNVPPPPELTHKSMPPPHEAIQ